MIKIIKKVDEKEFKDFLYQKMDADDPFLYEEMNGDPVDIFQMTGKTAIGVSRKVHPNNLEELTAVNALSRPGTISAMPDYISGKDSNIYKYSDKRINSILEKEHGVILYQETIMNIFNKIGGFSLEETDNVRGLLKKLGKKDKKQSDLDAWAEIVVRFKENAHNLGVSSSEVEQLSNDMVQLSSYSFNKSHALAYSKMAAVTLYLSTYFKKFYYSAVIEYEMDKDRDDVAKNLRSIENNGYTINPPFLNMKSGRTYADGKNIYIGLHNIKQMGASADAICSNGPYESFPDFIYKNREETTVNKRAVTGLVEYGTFDLIEKSLDRSKMIEAFNLFWPKKPTFKKGVHDESKDLKFKKSVEILWENCKQQSIDNIFSKKVTNSLLKELELKYLGFNYFISPFSKKMLAFVKENKEKIKFATFKDLLEEEGSKSRIVPAVVNSVRSFTDKNGNEMAFVQIEDTERGVTSIPIFASMYDILKSKLVIGCTYFMVLYSKFDDFKGKQQIMLGKNKFVRGEKEINTFLVNFS